MLDEFIQASYSSSWLSNYTEFTYRRYMFKLRSCGCSSKPQSLYHCKNNFIYLLICFPNDQYVFFKTIANAGEDGRLYNIFILLFDTNCGAGHAHRMDCTRWVAMHEWVIMQE